VVVKHESKIRVQAHEAETSWGGFLVDEDAAPSVTFFKRAKRSVATADLGIVLEARREGRTIITSNRLHFIGQIKELQNRPNNGKCSDLWGLLVIPNVQLIRDKRLKAIQHGLKVPGLGTLGWPGVAALNLYVHVTDEGTVNIYRFKRCPFCEDQKSGVKIKDPWKTWYYSLQVVGTVPGRYLRV
jgi:hypothetical protein